MNRESRIPVYLTQTTSWPSLSLGLLQAYSQSKTTNLGHYYTFNYISDHFIPFFYKKLAQDTHPSIWLFSNYIWNIDSNLSISKQIKAISSKNITIHGGPSAPKYESAAKLFLQENTHVDILVRGEGELSFVEVLQNIEPNLGYEPEAWLYTLAGISGITIAADSASEKILRTKERERINDLNIIPSPYLTGVFENVMSSQSFATLETNRGCPYGCTFCDWGSLTQQKIKQFDLARVKDEIDYLARKQIEFIFIADANFGIFKRDIEIAEYIARAKQLYGYPNEIMVTYAKNSNLKLAEIVKILTRAGLSNQGVISIQTTDEKTLEVIDRSNIKTKNYEELSRTFKKESLPLSVDLMIGLPGSTVASVKKDFQCYFDQDIFIKAYETRLLPNSPMANPEYIKKHSILVNDRNNVVSTYSYSKDDYKTMIEMRSCYELFEKYSFLRYVLRFIQWENFIEAMDLIFDFIAVNKSYPVICGFLKQLNNRKKLLELSASNLDEFYNEVMSFITNEYGIKSNSSLHSVIKFNQAVIPVQGKDYPFELELEHDVIKYFQDNMNYDRPISNKLLGTYAPRKCLIQDREGMRMTDSKQMDFHQIFWELGSPLKPAKSKPSFIN